MHTKGHSGVRYIRHGETRGVPKGDTFRGILELQLEAAVLELMVFWGTEKREWVGVSRIVPTYAYSVPFGIMPAR